MSSENDPIVVLTPLLRDLERYSLPRKKTIFDLGDRGHWENPTSDLLAFFMRPNEEHGFGDLFLRTLLETAGKWTTEIDLKDVTVSRERRFTDGRLDFWIQGLDWLVVVEAKIQAGVQNDLEAYRKEAYSYKFDPQKIIFLLLSLDGEIVSQDWKSVPFKMYFERLMEALDRNQVRAKDMNKWTVFAQDLLRHILNMYDEPMNDEQNRFVENNIEALIAGESLLYTYQADLFNNLNQATEKEFGIKFTQAGWRFLYNFTNPGLISCDVLFLTPFHKRSYRVPGKFVCAVQLSDQNPEQNALLRQVLVKKVRMNVNERNEDWIERRFTSSSEAKTFMLKLIGALKEFPN